MDTDWCALSPQHSAKGGVYCADCDISPIVPDDSPLSSGVRLRAIDPSAAKSLWDLSEKLADLRWVDDATPASPVRDGR